MPQAPRTHQEPYFHEEHGIKRSDPYHWLQNAKDPVVIAHLNAENNYTNDMMVPHNALKQTIYQETLSRIQETDQDYPWSYGQYEYYFRTVQGFQHDIFCRRLKNTLSEEILFDENVYAKSYEYFEVGQYALNLSQTTLAISIDTEGNERYQLFVLDLLNKESFSVSTDHAITQDVCSSVVFSALDHEYWYCRFDETQRPYQVWCHDLTGEKPDTLIYQEDDEQFTVSIYRSMSDAYLIIDVSSKLTSEIHFMDAKTPRGSLQLVRQRKLAHEYDIDHHGTYFYIRTNEDGPNFSLKRCKIDEVEQGVWETVLPLDPAIPLNSVTVFSNHLVIECRREGLAQIAVLNFTDFTPQWILFNEPTYTLSLGDNWEFNTHILRLSYVSLTTPGCDFALDMNTFEKKLLKQSPVLGGFDANDYASERIFATSDDGALIPISLVYKKALKKSAMPLFLTGYGAYGIDDDPHFSYSRLSLLDRGFVYAIAHVRGGGEYGDAWHEAGRFLHKKNTFHDFIACAQHLIAQQYTSSDQLVISGGSAGGLLIGAVINIAPQLFHKAIAQVPFVDVLNTMLDDSLPLTVLEYEEWGNPQDKKYYDYIRSYAPYENIVPQAYPMLFVTAGLHDPRVPYWEAAKWVARLRENQTAPHPILLRTQMSAGHQGPSGRYNAIEEVAEEFAFVLGNG